MNSLKGNLIDVEDIRVIRKFLVKNWLFLLGLPVLGGLIAAFYTHRMPEIYQAEMEILTKANFEIEQNTQSYTGLVQLYKNYADMTNQTRVIKSYDLISATLDKLDFELAYFVSGRIKTTRAERLPYFDINVIRVNPELYHKHIDIQIQDLDTYILSFDFAGEQITRQHSFDKEVNEPEYSLLVSKTSSLNAENLTKIQNLNYEFVVNTRSALVKQYIRNLSIENEEYTSILDIKVKDESQERAKMFLDSLALVYQEFTMETQKLLNKKTTQYIDRQLFKVTEVLDSIEDNLENYKETKSILDLTREEEEFFGQMTLAEKRKVDLELEHESKSSLRNYLLDTEKSEVAPPALYISDDAYLKEALSKLYELQFEKNLKLNQVTDENIKIQRDEKTIEEQRNDILVYIKASQSAIKDKIAEIDKQIQHYEAKIKKIPASERDILNINRRLKVNEELLQFLLEKRANSEIAKAAILPQTRVLVKSRPIGQVGPDTQRYMLLFIGGALILAALISYIRFAMFDRLENVRELKNVTSVPVLGGIPSIEKDLARSLIVNAKKRLNVTESFRAIRTNLQYLNRSKENKVILVSSLHPGEGKTFFSSNLAAIIAKAGKKVLLLDFDLHKPKVHRTAGLDNTLGITSILTNDFTFNQVIQDTEIPELKVIACGPPPPNPSEMVMSEKVGEIITKARKEYDFIVVDTPPILLISDALVLRNLSDIGIFVMNTVMATKAGTRHLEELLEKNQSSNNAIVLNNIKRKTWKYYPYKYGYAYDYGYGYSYTYSTYAEEKSEA
ncbi:MAG: polysaccharide biosynthesis tyrosine autokinase [Bacteroidota bacterium]